MRKQLTAEMIEKLKAPATGRLEIFDSIVPAMALRVTAAGAKSFVVRARVKGQPEPIRVTIGDATAVKLSAARQEASDLLKVCRAGTDPREERKRQLAAQVERRANTFGAVAEEFIKRHVSKLRSKDGAEGVIRRELLGQYQTDEGGWTDDPGARRWRERPITEIARRDVVKLLEDIVDSGRPYLARVVLAYVRKLFHWAVERDVYGLAANPCYGVSATNHGAPTVPRQVTIGPDHLRLLWKAADTLGDPAGPFFKMLMLSGQRRNEIARLQWSEIDIAEKVIVLPPERMKAKRPHEIPLSTAMAELLQHLQESRGSGDFVFSTMFGKRPISGFGKLKARLDKKTAGLLAGEKSEAEGRGEEFHGMKELPAWRIHDMRRTMRTGIGAVPAIAPDVRELVIAHVPPALVRTYDLHSYREEKRQALEMWAQRLKNIVDPSPPANNVVTLPTNKPTRAKRPARAAE